MLHPARVASLIVVLALEAEAYLFAARRMHFRTWEPLDLGVYRDGGLALLHHAALYSLVWQEGTRFTYPPFAAVLFIGLAAHAQALETACILVVNLALLGVCLRRTSRLAGRTLPGWALIVAAVIVLPAEPTTLTLSLGQINLVIAALVISDLSLADDSRAQGAMIGLAAGLKLTPLIFVAYLLLIGRWRSALRAIATFGATILLSLAVAPGATRRFWFGALFLQPGRAGATDTIRNQSLLGALERIGMHGPEITLISAAVGVGGLALAARSYRHGDRLDGFFLCALTGLLVSPISWIHHWVIVMPALPYLILTRPGWPRLSGLAIGAWALLWPLTRAFPPQHVDLSVHGFARQVDASGYVLIGLSVLGLAALWALRRADVSAPGSISARDP